MGLRKNFPKFPLIGRRRVTRLKKENYRVKVRGEGDWVKKREKEKEKITPF